MGYDNTVASRGEVGFAPGSARCEPFLGILIEYHAPKWRVHFTLVLTDSISSIHLDSDLGTLRLADQFKKRQRPKNYRQALSCSRRQCLADECGCTLGSI